LWETEVALLLHENRAIHHRTVEAGAHSDTQRTVLAEEIGVALQHQNTPGWVGSDKENCLK
jgi:hypothetical protein